MALVPVPLTVSKSAFDLTARVKHGNRPQNRSVCPDHGPSGQSYELLHLMMGVLSRTMQNKSHHAVKRDGFVNMAA
jgi:hypothetical protein